MRQDPPFKQANLCPDEPIVGDRLVVVRYNYKLNVFFVPYMYKPRAEDEYGFRVKHVKTQKP